MKKNENSHELQLFELFHINYRPKTILEYLKDFLIVFLRLALWQTTCRTQIDDNLKSNRKFIHVLSFDLTPLNANQFFALGASETIIKAFFIAINLFFFCSCSKWSRSRNKKYLILVLDSTSLTFAMMMSWKISTLDEVFSILKIHQSNWNWSWRQRRVESKQTSIFMRNVRDKSTLWRAFDVLKHQT